MTRFPQGHCSLAVRHAEFQRAYQPDDPQFALQLLMGEASYTPEDQEARDFGLRFQNGKPEYRTKTKVPL